MFGLALALITALVAILFIRIGRISRLGKTLTLVLMVIFTLQTLVQLSSYVVGGEGFNEAVFYHLVYGLEGAGVGQFRLAILRTGGALTLWFGVIWLVLFSQLFERLLGSFLHLFSARKLLLGRIGSILTVSSVCAHPLVFDAWKTFHPSGNVQPMLDAYIVPQPLTVPTNRPNLVIIYLESLERTYFDETIFPGLIQHLRNWESKSLSFTGIRQTFGTGWTIAGMVASQCGLPLVPKGVDFAMLEDKTPDRNDIRGSLFLPGATCLGDLLKDVGYHTVYMGGASSAFAGKANFYRTHGFTETYGKQDLLPKVGGEGKGSWWGLYDDELFQLLTEKFAELYAGDKPFALATLTLDTHGGADMPYSPSCTSSPAIAKDNLNLRAVACTDQLVDTLIRRIRELDTKKNTYVVVASDHLAMENSASHLLRKGERRNLLFINTPDDSLRGVNQRTASTLSSGATFLDAMGFDIGSLGLGRSLLRPEKTLEEQLGEGAYNTLSAWAPEFRKFWNFSRLSRRNTKDNQEENMK